VECLILVMTFCFLFVVKNEEEEQTKLTQSSF
jgi:hypothetical protein